MENIKIPSNLKKRRPRIKRLGDLFHRYLSFGAQPTFLEILEREYSLLSPANEQRLKKRIGIHSHLKNDIENTAQLKKLFQEIAHPGIIGSSQDQTQILSPKLKSLYQKIEKRIESGDKSPLVSRSFTKQSKGYLQWNRLTIENIWPNWFFYKQRVRVFAYSAMVLVIFITGAILFNHFHRNAVHGPSIIAFHTKGSLFKSKRPLSSLDINALPKAESQKLLAVKPMDNFISGENSAGRIYFSDGTAFQIGPETSLSMGKRDTNKFVLDHGIVHFYIPKQDKNKPVVITGEDFQIKVIGTRFVLGLSENSLRLILEKGLIEFLYIVKDEKQKTILEAPSMIEVLDRKTLPRIKHSQVSKELIKYLGAFMVLNKAQENFWAGSSIHNSFNLEQSNVFWNSPLYGKDIPLSEIKNLYEFKRFFNETNENDANHIYKSTQKMIHNNKLKNYQSENSTLKDKNTNSVKTPFFKKESSNKDKFSPFHPGYTK